MIRISEKLKSYEPLTEKEFEIYSPIVHRAISDYFKKDHGYSPVAIFCSREDFLGELYPTLLSSIRAFDPESRMSIESWIYFKCQKAIIDAIRNKYWIKKDTYKALVDNKEEISQIIVNSEVAAEISLTLQDNTIPENILEQSELTDYLFTDLNFRDPIEGKEILLKYFVEEKTLKQIGNELGVSDTAIHHKIKRVKPLIKKRFREYSEKID